MSATANRGPIPSPLPPGVLFARSVSSGGDAHFTVRHEGECAGSVTFSATGEEALQGREALLEGGDLDLLVQAVRVAGRAWAEVDRVQAALGELRHRRPRLLRLHVGPTRATQAVDQRVREVHVRGGRVVEHLPVG